MTVHDAQSLDVIRKPPLWPEFLCILAPNTSIAVLHPGVNTNDCLIHKSELRDI